MRERLARLAAVLERQCCSPSDIAFEVKALGSDALRFEIRGAAAVTSLVVCCALPVATVSLRGSGIAAPLLLLDDACVIGAVALVVGAEPGCGC